jgi:S-disulfanyl-L-cysteine oxidoreductase SoxD
MRCSKLLLAAIVMLACGAALAQAPVYHLGRTPTKEEINALDLSIHPSGRGLPSGSGTAKEGAKIYEKKCVQCHGPTGAEGPSLSGAVKLWPYSSARDGYVPPTLAGGKNGMEGIWASPVATTIWSYIKRAMPPRAEGSLSADEVYSLTAWLLNRRGIIQENDIMNAKTLPKAPMPNRACIPWNFSCTEPAGASSGR